MKTLFEYQNILGYNRILDWRDDFHNYKTVLARRIDFFYNLEHYIHKPFQYMKGVVNIHIKASK